MYVFYWSGSIADAQGFSKGKSPAPKLKNIDERYADKIWQIQITIATLMQPLQYDLRGPAAKTIVFRTQPRRQATLTQQITVRSAETELQNTIESQERRRKRGLNWQLHCGADPRMIPNERVPQPPAGQASPSIFRGTFFVRQLKHKISCIC